LPDADKLTTKPEASKLSFVDEIADVTFGAIPAFRQRGGRKNAIHLGLLPDFNRIATDLDYGRSKKI
jgi:hypothetical protein